MPLNLKETSYDWFVCQCGNEPYLDGFFPCLTDGTPVEPVIDGNWDGVLYVCAKCYAIYDQDTFDQVGEASQFARQALIAGLHA